MLTEFIKNKFRIFFEISLWLNLIGCAICGTAIGYNFTRIISGSFRYDGYGLGFGSGSLGHGFIGLIFGILVGISSNVLFCGPIAIFLNIEEKT